MTYIIYYFIVNTDYGQCNASLFKLFMSIRNTAAYHSQCCFINFIMIWKCSQYAQNAFQFTFKLLHSFTVPAIHLNIQFHGNHMLQIQYYYNHIVLCDMWTHHCLTIHDHNSCFTFIWYWEPQKSTFFPLLTEFNKMSYFYIIISLLTANW